MCLYCLRLRKTHYFPHTVYYYISSMPCLSETCWFLQSSSFWEARRALIGLQSCALWLAEYLKHEMEMLRPSPYCDAVFQRNETKTIKLVIKEALVASSGDIITDYNDLHCLFIIAKLSFESSLAETYLQAVSQKRQTVLAKFEFSHFIDISWAYLAGFSQVQEIVLHTL